MEDRHDDHVVLLGGILSPYSRKVLAVLRYKRVPHRFVIRDGLFDKYPRAPGPPLLPNIVFPDRPDRAMADSTFIIAELDSRHPARAVRMDLSREPVTALLCNLLEDFFDEWLTKAMFHFRWGFEDDAGFGAVILPGTQDGLISRDAESFENIGTQFKKRQVGRLAVVGSSPQTRAIIEDSFVRLLRALQAHLQAGFRFLFGDRPSNADFACYAQLSQLVLVDPTSAKLARIIAPRVVAWTLAMDDLSGMEVADGGWVRVDAAADVPPTLRTVLRLVGTYYAPFLVANAAAVERKDKLVHCVVDGTPYSQNAFKYQAKCLSWLRGEYLEMPTDAHRARFLSVISGTGCEVIFQGPSGSARL